MRIRQVVLLVVFAAACTEKNSGSTDSVIGAGVGSGAGAATDLVVQAPDASFSVHLPAHWARVYRVDTLSTAERGMARPGALNIVYLPSDSSAIPQTLVVVAVYDSEAWSRVKAEGGPPPGDSVFAKDGRVYVLGLPQSNPFSPGSLDAVKFDSLALTAADKTRIIRVP